MQSILMVRALFWLRAKMLGARMPAARRLIGLVDDMLTLGWGCLADEPGFRSKKVKRLREENFAEGIEL